MPDIRPLRSRDPQFRFLVWGRDSIFWATSISVAGPPGARPDGPVVGRSLVVYSLGGFDEGSIPVVVDDKLEGWLPRGTQAGPAKSGALCRILDPLLFMAWGRERSQSEEQRSAERSRVQWLLDEIRSLGSRAPVWSSFHYRAAPNYVMQVLSPTYRFTFPDA